MLELLIAKIALIGLLGVGAQWLAWRMQLPAIVLLLLAGVLVGPATGLINPVEDFRGILNPLISIAVAIILFEGGLTLDFKQIRGASTAVRRIVMFGAPLTFALTTVAARQLAGLSWPSALVLSGILVVTGPTVIMPLLRQSRLQARVASMLRWEAILADPLGALIAMLVFEGFLVLGVGHGPGQLVLRLAAAAMFSLIGGYYLGRFVVFLFVRGHVPEYLKIPLIFVTVIAGYAISDILLEESGLLTVTVLGVTLANSRIASLGELRRFKEMMTVLLVSGVFIVLTATLHLTDLTYIDRDAIGFILAVLFLVRPISVFVVTLGSELSWRERMLVGWIAPRGVVAVAVAGLFGALLTTHGVEDAHKLIPIAFAIVFVTVVLHGFTIGPLSRLLGLSAAGPTGLIIVGGSRFAVEFGQAAKELGLPVMIADRNFGHLREARLADLPVFYGEILSEAAEHAIEFHRFGYLVAATDNELYNALICTDFGPELGRGNVFQIDRTDGKPERHEMAVTLGGRPFLDDLGGYDGVMRKMAEGWTFQITKLTEEYGPETFLADRKEGTKLVLARRGENRIVWLGGRKDVTLQAGDAVLSFGPVAPDAQTKEHIGTETAAV